ENSLKNAQHAQPRLPLGLGTEQVFFRHHFENRADVLRHAAMDEHQTILKFLAHGERSLFLFENAMLWHEATSTDTEFGIALGGERAFDEFDSWPHAARILPAAARATEPFAKKSARQHEPSFVFVE